MVGQSSCLENEYVKDDYLMKIFDLDKFNRDLTELQASIPQLEFYEKLNNSIGKLLSLKIGKKIPSSRILKDVCSFKYLKPNDYFVDIEQDEDKSSCILSVLEGKDKEIIHKTIKRICIKEKYSKLSKRY